MNNRELISTQSQTFGRANVCAELTKTHIYIFDKKRTDLVAPDQNTIRRSN